MRPDPGDTLELTLHLRPNRELETLLGFGEAVEVLAPAALRQRLAARLRAAAGRYGTGAAVLLAGGGTSGG